MPYLSASAVVIHYEEELYQLYIPFTFTLHYAAGLHSHTDLTVENVLAIGASKGE